ncbi:MAG: CDP-alcohol phosphatidyltransferase family protein [Candidatus Bathyarchaeota archaeon]|nr:CDP-alcohol phosphatidyltransferase family protein [Candidatus Bathyarchaeota archaeon]
MEESPLGLYSRRSDKDTMMLRIASVAYGFGLTPNMMTAMGLTFGLASGALFALQSMPLALLFGCLSVLCDVLDGTLARKFHMESKFGLMFDSISDRLAEFAVVLGALAGGIIHPLGAIAIVGSASLLAFRFASYRRGSKTDYVLFGRFERLTLILAGLLSPIVWVSTIFFAAAGALSLVSSCQIALKLHRHKTS